MTAPRPYALLAEVTYRCPLHCPYCSNPVALPVAALLGEAPRRPQGGGDSNGELTTEEWKRVIRESELLLGLNLVIHRRNIDRLPQMIELADSLGAVRVELANVQFYGWAFLNRAALLPTREQVPRARAIAIAAKARPPRSMEIFYVLPDYYESRPKPCLNGWGQRYLTVNPIGDVLPCPTASSAIPDLHFENVRARNLDWIWRESESFTRFRGTDWMPEPCRSCPQREKIGRASCRERGCKVGGRIDRYM